MSRTQKTILQADINTLVFAGRYDEALKHADLNTRWKVLSLLGLNRLDEAEQVIQAARDGGEHDAVAYLAAIHRLRGESRLWLLESKIFVTAYFEYCVLLREIAIYYTDLQKFHLAEETLERALHMTTHDEDTRQLLPSLAQSYANAAHHLGHDTATISVLRDGLNIAVAGRRTPLLVQLAYTYAMLGQLQNLRATLEEIAINPPAPETAYGMIVSFSKAQLLYLEGDVRSAHKAFEELYQGALEWESEVVFYAAVWSALTQLEGHLNKALDPYEWLALMRDHASDVPKHLSQGWITCVEAIIERNPQTATRAAEHFKLAYAKREEAFALTLPAVFETDKANGQTQLEHVIRESMTEALEIAEQIENYAPIKRAMRFSKNASPLNKYLPSSAKSEGTKTPLIIRDGKAFRDGAEQRLPRHNKAVSILEHFKQNSDGVVLDDMLKIVFAESELENSRKYWTSLRPILERETRARFERRKIKGKYLWFLLTDEKAVAVPQKVV